MELSYTDFKITVVNIHKELKIIKKEMENFIFH